MNKVLTPEELEVMERYFDFLDNQLHAKTYSMLEDEVFKLTDDLDEANGNIERFIELEEEGRYK